MTDTIVVKVGGARAVDPEGTLDDVATLVEEGYEVVLVHGGSTAVDDTLEAMGRQPEYVETPDGVVGRFTDEETMEVFEMVLPGRVNTDLVAALQAEGVQAVGLSGVDGGLLSGPRTSAIRVVEDGKRMIRRGDHSGRIESVNEDLLVTLLSGGFTPVVTVPMLADGDTPVNVDTDAAAGAIAAALDATLVVLTDVPGILADPDDEESVFGDVVHPAAFEAVNDAAEGFMTRKVMAVETAISGGAPEAIVASANEREPVTTALSGGGTHVHPEALQ